MSIYFYTDTTSLLNDYYQKKKRNNPSFSIRSWAAQMGMKHHGPLQQVLAGNRSIPKKYIPNLIKSMRLSAKEGLYFETLVDLEKSHSPEQSLTYYDRLKEMRPSKDGVKILDIQYYKFFMNPLHSIIRTMTERKDFKNCTKFIKSKLAWKTTESEIKSIIENLIDLKLLEKTSEDKLIKVNKHVRSKPDIPSNIIQDYHKRMCDEAKDAIGAQSVDMREYSSLCFNLKADQFKKAREELREMVDSFIQKYEAEPFQSNETYQLNIQLFSLTKN